MSTLQEVVDRSRRMVFFGGAGVSTESGIPDFRSAEGLYSGTHTIPPETVLSHTFFMQHPTEFFAFYRAHLLYLTAQPNPAHRKLAAWEQAGTLAAVVTQNIDGLHQKAGSKTVFELHGSVHRNRCMRCGALFDAAFVAAGEGVPLCPCGGTVKPEVVLYEEPLDDRTVRGAVAAIAAADTLIVAGTSLAVYPAAGLTRYFRGRDLVLINRDETPLDREATLVLHENVGAALDKLHG